MLDSRNGTQLTLSYYGQLCMYAAGVSATDGGGNRLRYLTCKPCQVSWRGAKDDPCWVCGQPGTFRGYWDQDTK